MAHFAQLDDNNKVKTVIVVNNDSIKNDSGNEDEAVGIAFCKSLYGQDTKWVQTSYNSNFRKQFAGVDDTYDEAKDIFISRQPYPSWTLDDNSDWQAPVAYPEDGTLHVWNEANQVWDKIE
tara:strand:+ start:1482 stop:1844 length:363 start_codon:yes stop_codon:yes gene_type:complete